jgi:hypothetical protein
MTQRARCALLKKPFTFTQLNESGFNRYPPFCSLPRESSRLLGSLLFGVGINRRLCGLVGHLSEAWLLEPNPPTPNRRSRKTRA